MEEILLKIWKGLNLWPLDGNSLTDWIGATALAGAAAKYIFTKPKDPIHHIDSIVHNVYEAEKREY